MLFFESKNDSDALTGLTIPDLFGVGREKCTLELRQSQIDYLHLKISAASHDDIDVNSSNATLVRLAFIIKDAFSDSELIKFIKRVRPTNFDGRLDDVYSFLKLPVSGKSQGTAPRKARTRPTHPKDVR